MVLVSTVRLRLYPQDKGQRMLNRISLLLMLLIRPILLPTALFAYCFTQPFVPCGVRSGIAWIRRFRQWLVFPILMLITALPITQENLFRAGSSHVQADSLMIHDILRLQCQDVRSLSLPIKMMNDDPCVKHELTTAQTVLIGADAAVRLPNDALERDQLRRQWKIAWTQYPLTLLQTRAETFGVLIGEIEAHLLPSATGSSTQWFISGDRSVRIDQTPDGPRIPTLLQLIRLFAAPFELIFGRFINMTILALPTLALIFRHRCWYLLIPYVYILNIAFVTPWDTTRYAIAPTLVLVILLLYAFATDYGDHKGKEVE